MFYIIGLGLGDAKDITIKGLEIVKAARRVYLESYTSTLSAGKDDLETFYGRELIIAERELVEQGTDEILEGAKEDDVALLVVGDPFGATTHTDLVLRARHKEIPVKIVHNASILTAVGITGLQLYSFGETISIPFWTESWKPDSFFERIEANHIRGLHTLCLLDIKVKEPTIESMMRKKPEYMPPRFMTVAEAASQLLEIVKKHPDSPVKEDSLCVGVARAGAADMQIGWGSLLCMATADLGTPLHSLIITGHLHPLELEFLEPYRLQNLDLGEV